MSIQQVSKGEFDRRVKLLEQKVQESANKLVNDYKEFVERIDSIVSDNGDFNRYRAIVDRINACFDTDTGQFDGSHIKPLSIETAALSVGQRSQQLTLKNVKFVVDNYGDVNSQDTTQENNPRTNYGVLKVVNDNGNTTGTYGELTHFTLFDKNDNGTIKPTVATFRLQYDNSITIDDSTLHYVYAKLPCNKVNDVYLYEELSGTPTTPIAEIEISTQQYKIDDNYRDNNKFLYVLLGTISAELTDSNSDLSHKYYRIVDLNYGLTTINGRLITTGRIEGSTQDGAYFDLDKGEIGGNIVFTAGSKSLANLQDVISGGVNLFRLTAMNDRSNFTYSNNTNFTKYFRYYNGNISKHSFSVYSGNIYQDTITLVSGTNMGIAFARLASEINLDPNSYYTMSCWAKCSVSASICLGTSYYKTNNTWVWRGGNNPKSFNSINTWQHFVYTFKPDSDTQAICYCFTVNGTTNETFTIRNCKLEKGALSTDWTPAPEDTENNILYATCDTNGNVQTKVIVCPDLTSDFLSKSNMRMKIKFSKAAGKFASSINVNLQFEFRSESNGSAIRPNGTNQDIVLMKYHGYTAYDTPSNNLYMPYWNADQEMEITFSDITNNILSIKIVDEEIFDTMTSISNAISGTTTIAGGLILTDTIIAGSSSSQAGINGLSTNDVAFWAGGNIGSARNFNTPVVIKRNGDAKFGVVNIDQYSGSLCMIENNNKRLEIKSGVLTYPGTAKVYNPNNSANDAETNTAHRDSGTGINTSISSSTVTTKYIFENSNESDHLITLQPNPTNKYNFYVYLSFSSAKINVTTTSNIGNARIVLEFYNGSEWEIIHTYECNTQYVQEYPFDDELSFKLSYSNYNTLGNAKIGLRAKYNIDNNAIATITLSNPKWYYYQDLNKICTQIAKNGFSLYIGNSNTFSVSTSNEQRLDTIIKGRIQITGDGDDSFITNVTGGISSDIRFKKDINNFNAIELLSKLNFIKFHWNELAKEKLNSNTDQQCYGLIAQNSDGVIDNMVKHEDENFDYQRVDYNLLIPILGKAINELVEKNKLLEERIALLESNQ